MIRKAAWAGALSLILLGAFMLLQPGNELQQESPAEDRLMTFLAQSPEDSFAQVLPGRPIVFPRDHGVHSDFRQEWWYFTGRLESAKERVFGYQLTFFRFGSGEAVQSADSAWSSRQTWMAHLAVTDVVGQRFMAAEDFSRGVLGLAGAESDRFHVWTHHWSVERIGSSNNCRSCFIARLEAETDDLALDFNLESVSPPILQGDAGYSTKNAEGSAASYYYSLPGLVTHGTVRIGTETFAVQGESWMDREWSTAVLTSEQQGWDWFSLNLDNGYRVMAFQVRESDQDPFRSATILDANHNKRFPGQTVVQLTPRRFWSNPRQDASYPVDWDIEGTTPEDQWSLQVSPVLDQQEMNLTVRYFEGLVDVEGIWNGEPVRGWGYMELTGYRVP